MTIDNESRAIVTRPLAEVMDTYASSATHEDLAILAEALKDSTARYVAALKKGNTDAALGCAVKMEAYADKLHSFTKRLASAGGY